MSTFLEQTRQVRRVMGTFATTIVGAGVMLAGMVGVIGGAASSWWMALEVCGALVALVGFLGGAASVRCPKCGARFFWQALRSLTFEEAMRSVLTTPVCPACGSAGVPRPLRSRESLD